MNRKKELTNNWLFVRNFCAIMGFALFVVETLIGENESMVSLLIGYIISFIFLFATAKIEKYLYCLNEGNVWFDTIFLWGQADEEDEDNEEVE